MLSLSLDIIHKLSRYIRYATWMFSAHYIGGPWGHAGRRGRCGSAHNDGIQQWNDFVFNFFTYPCKLVLRTHLQYPYSLLWARLQYLPSQRVTDLMLSCHWTIYCISLFTWDHIIPSLISASLQKHEDWCENPPSLLSNRDTSANAPDSKAATTDGGDSTLPESTSQNFAPTHNSICAYLMPARPGLQPDPPP